MGALCPIWRSSKPHAKFVLVLAISLLRTSAIRNFTQGFEVRSVYKKLGSTQVVVPRTVLIETGEVNLVEKFALTPREPGPVLSYSANVTWSVLEDARSAS